MRLPLRFRSKSHLAMVALQDLLAGFQTCFDMFVKDPDETPMVALFAIGTSQILLLEMDVLCVISQQFVVDETLFAQLALELLLLLVNGIDVELQGARKFEGQLAILAFVDTWQRQTGFLVFCCFLGARHFLTRQLHKTKPNGEWRQSIHGFFAMLTSQRVLNQGQEQVVVVLLIRQRNRFPNRQLITEARAENQNKTKHLLTNQISAH